MGLKGIEKRDDIETAAASRRPVLVCDAALIDGVATSTRSPSRSTSRSLKTLVSLQEVVFRDDLE